MPMYEYSCPKCGDRYEVIKSFSDEIEKDICPKCGAEAKRVFSEPAAVVYHGSGYYCTDSKHGAGCGCANCKGGAS